VDNNKLLMIFIGVASVAIVLQALALIGIYKAVRVLSQRLDEMASGIAKDLHALSTKADDVLTTVKSVGEGIDSLRQNVEKTLVVVHNRIESLDNFLGETTDMARLELLRLRDAIDTSARKIEEVFDVLRNGIIAPAMEVSAIVRGIRKGVDFLFRRQKGISRAFPQDEEMFI